MSIISRLNNLWRGFISLFVGRLEEKNPEAVYESAINQRVQQYQVLMKAVSGIVYLRNKLEKEYEDKTNQLQELMIQIPLAVQDGDDDLSVILIDKKNILTADLERVKKEFDKMVAQSEESKENLVNFQAEIEKLRSEKVTMLSKRENALAQKKIEEQLSGLSVDADIVSLTSVRDNINRLEAELDVNKEINGQSLESKLKTIKNKTSSSVARTELEEMKKQMNMSRDNVKTNEKNL